MLHVETEDRIWRLVEAIDLRRNLASEPRPWKRARAQETMRVLRARRRAEDRHAA